MKGACFEKSDGRLREVRDAGGGKLDEFRSCGGGLGCFVEELGGSGLLIETEESPGFDLLAKMLGDQLAGLVVGVVVKPSENLFELIRAEDGESAPERVRIFDVGRVGIDFLSFHWFRGLKVRFRK